MAVRSLVSGLHLHVLKRPPILFAVASRCGLVCPHAPVLTAPCGDMHLYGACSILLRVSTCTCTYSTSLRTHAATCNCTVLAASHCVYLHAPVLAASNCTLVRLHVHVPAASRSGLQCLHASVPCQRLTTSMTNRYFVTPLHYSFAERYR